MATLSVQPTYSVTKAEKNQTHTDRFLLRQGRCPACGIYTHEKRKGALPMTADLVPITNALVHNGRCLTCHPLEESSGRAEGGGGTSLKPLSVAGDEEEGETVVPPGTLAGPTGDQVPPTNDCPPESSEWLEEPTGKSGASDNQSVTHDIAKRRKKRNLIIAAIVAVAAVAIAVGVGVAVSSSRSFNAPSPSNQSSGIGGLQGPKPTPTTSPLETSSEGSLSDVSTNDDPAAAPPTTSPSKTTPSPSIIDSSIAVLSTLPPTKWPAMPRPTLIPTQEPTDQPSAQQSTGAPTVLPTLIPTLEPTDQPSAQQSTGAPTVLPTAAPVSPSPTGFRTIKQNAVLAAPQFDPKSDFGSAVAVDGDTAAVGARYDDHGTKGVNRDGNGSVYVYRRSADGTAWTMEARIRLDASHFLSQDQLGSAVAVSGNVLLAGSFQKRAFAFVRSEVTGGWSAPFELGPSDEGNDGIYHWTVAVDGDTALAGAPRNDGGAINSGSVYVYAHSGPNEWTHQAKLVADDAEGWDEFGQSLAIDRDIVVVGSPGANRDDSGDKGRAYVFERTGITWTQTAVLIGDDVGRMDHFGSDVAVSFDTVLVGAEDTHGSAFVFVKSGPTWTQQAKLVASDKGGRGGKFGCSVALKGNVAIVGARNDDSVYVFARAEGRWTQRAKLEVSGFIADSFGSAVAFDGSTAVAGAPTDSSSENVRSAYVYDMESFFDV